MKIINTLAVISVIMLGLTQHAFADDTVQTCEERRTSIEEQIGIAKSFGNTDKVAGLERKLDAVNNYCTKDSVIEDAKAVVAKYEQKVANQQRKIDKYQDKLNEANTLGDKKKMAEYQTQLKEEQNELAQQQTKLDAARRQLADLQ